MEKEFNRLVDDFETASKEFARDEAEVDALARDEYVEEAKKNLIDHVLKWVKQGDK